MTQQCVPPPPKGEMNMGAAEAAGSASLRDLIGRLESAEVGSRVLDAGIHRFFGGKCTVSHEINPQPCDEAGNYLPCYTTSLDAALTLVPERHWWELRRRKLRWGRSIPSICNGRHLAEAVIGPDDAGYRKRSGLGCAMTPALAVCIAALKARENARLGEPAEGGTPHSPSSGIPPSPNKE